MKCEWLSLESYVIREGTEEQYEKGNGSYEILRKRLGSPNPIHGKKPQR